MGVFVVPHAVKHVLANASKKGVFGLCIPRNVIGFFVREVLCILRRGKAFGGGSKDTNVLGLEVRLHTNFPIRKIVAIEHGRWSIPVGHLALGG
jgi:hypothetical protein